MQDANDELLIISIHAPVRGATTVVPEPEPTPQISIHAPVRGATFFDGFFILFFLDFNPRSREGSDDNRFIHFTRGTDFNPRSREGSDYTCVLSPVCFLNFNPRSREGSDDRSARGVKIMTISIHAPVRGATIGVLEE